MCGARVCLVCLIACAFGSQLHTRGGTFTRKSNGVSCLPGVVESNFSQASPGRQGHRVPVVTPPQPGQGTGIPQPPCWPRVFTLRNSTAEGVREEWDVQGHAPHSVAGNGLRCGDEQAVPPVVRGPPSPHHACICLCDSCLVQLLLQHGRSMEYDAVILADIGRAIPTVAYFGTAEAPGSVHQPLSYPLYWLLNVVVPGRARRSCTGS